MDILDRITAFHDELTAWRRDLHAHPELGFDEHRTADFVADKLESFGVQVHRGIGKTGLVGVLREAVARRKGHRAALQPPPLARREPGLFDVSLCRSQRAPASP